MFRMSWKVCPFFACWATLAGCGMLGNRVAPTALSDAVAGNPLFVPVADRERVWTQVVDEIDNYFDIEREERVRLAGNVLTEGTITTYNRIGSSVLEPWHRDSSAGYEKLLSTLQTIRRRATVRVIPTVGGYLIDVAVFKEMEDRIAGETFRVGPSVNRFDDSLVRYDARGETDRTPFDDPSPSDTGWLPLGRDPQLEQRIIDNLAGRLRGL